MRLSRFSVENYRAFVDRVSLELRPLTLLFGYNSAGKSALLRFLPIVAASSNPDQLTPLALDAPAARGASFRDLLSRHGSSPTLRLGLEWEDEPGAAVETALDIRDVPERQLQVVDRLKVARGVSQLEAIWNADPASLASRTRHYDVTHDGQAVGTLPISFEGLVPISDAIPQVRDHLAPAAVELRMLRHRVQWLNSLRAVPKRICRFGAPPSRLSPDGANAGDYLAHDSLAEGTLIRQVSSVFEKITGHRLEIKRYAVAGEDQYSIMIAPTGASPSIEIPIVDTGEGMAQLLPVVVLGCLAQLGLLPLDAILVVEHPEVHLHPAAHAPLAEFFCGLAVLERTPTTFIETHSENFLLRVQIAIAKGELPADKVIVHWIRALDGMSVVDTITFDDAARPQGAGWPPGVFSEDLMQARELLAIRKARGFA